MTYNADSIKVLSGIEHVRKRPAMYIGSTGWRGANHLVYEIVDNAVDEFCQGYGSCVSVLLSDDGYCTVEDNGRGIPVDVHPNTGTSALRTVLTTLNAGGKFDSNSYRYSSGLHGVGSSVVNALSEHFKVRVYRDGKRYEDEYRKGVPVVSLSEDGSLPYVDAQDHPSGTSVTFKPDTFISAFKPSNIKERLHEICYLNPGLTVKYRDCTVCPEDAVTYIEPNGISQLVEDMCSDTECTCGPCSFSDTFEGNNGDIEVQVCFRYTTSSQESILGFCNGVNTVEGGTHVTAFKSALTSLVNQYAKHLGVLKGDNARFQGSDVRSGLVAVVSVKHPDPQFEGQTKTKLNNQDAYRAVSNVCHKHVQMHLDRNVEDAKAIVSSAEKSLKVREAQTRTARNILAPRRKYSFYSNGKIAGCESKDYSKNELFVVEGESAAGSGKMARNRKYQAILPIRGKILNVEKAPVEKILANTEIQTLIYALGCGFSEGYGQDFDISKLKYDKIICMCFTGDTRVKCLNGNSYSFKELVDNKVEELWVYSRDEHGNVVPALATNPRQTGTTTKLCEVELDNGKVTRCTPDHLFMMSDGSYKQAQHLKPVDSLSTLHIKKSRGGHNRYYDDRIRSWRSDPLFAQGAHFSNGAVEAPELHDRESNKECCGTGVAHHKDSNKASIMDRKVVGVKVLDVPETPVYCLTVADNRNFCLNDGEFVHNCDSDVDGYHIVTLLLTVFYRLLPELIYQGHVYVACPPLYRAIPRNGKERYLYTDKDLEQYRKSHTNFRLQRYKGLGEMNPSQLWETTMNPETRLLKKVFVSSDSGANSITSKLMGSSSELRKRFIFEHAKEANLDV